MTKSKKQWYYDRINDQIFIHPLYPDGYGNAYRDRIGDVANSRKLPNGETEFFWLTEGEFYKLRQPNEITLIQVAKEFNDAMDRMKYASPTAVQLMPTIYKYYKARKKKHDDQHAAERFKHKALSHA